MKVSVNGFQIQQAIREAKAERDQASARFTPSLRHFPGDVVMDPRHVAADFQAAEERLSQLQALQAKYNLCVKVTVIGNEITLLEAIKKVGGLGRLEKMWRSAAAPKADRYGYRDETRDKDAVVSVPTVTYDVASKKRAEVSHYASALRSAIQMGNANVVELLTDVVL